MTKKSKIWAKISFDRKVLKGKKLRNSTRIANKYAIKIRNGNELVPNLGNKSKYILYYKNLPLYLSLRIKLTKSHRILKFKQIY